MNTITPKESKRKENKNSDYTINDIEEAKGLMANSENQIPKKNNTSMKNPEMVNPTRKNYVAVNDIDLIDPSLVDDYKDTTIYEPTQESETFISCYKTCGKFP